MYYRNFMHALEKHEQNFWEAANNLKMSVDDRKLKYWNSQVCEALTQIINLRSENADHADKFDNEKVIIAPSFILSLCAMYEKVLQKAKLLAVHRAYLGARISYLKGFLPVEKTEEDPKSECLPGSKYDSDKRRFSLLPLEATNEVIDVLEFGAKKYAVDNWQQVPDARTRYYDAALRHIFAWFGGEKLDPETGKHHLAHGICCLTFLLWMDLKGKF